MVSEGPRDHGAVAEAGKVATGIIDSLKSQPIVLFLMVFNLVFLGTVYLSVSHGRESQEKLLINLMTQISETSKLLYNCQPTH